MKKIIQKLLILIIGITIGGGISVLASNYILKASDIKYNESKTVQQAVEELYSLVENKKGNIEKLPIGDVTVSGTQISISYTGSYDKVYCVYGIDETYGNNGTISGNICTFSGSSNTKYYYKMVSFDNNGKIYEISGSKETLSGPTRVLTNLPLGVKAIIYMDPTDITKSCNETNSISTTGTQKGCMKWYAYNENSNSYIMILDHDVSNSTYRSYSNSDWLLTPRLITKDEVTLITGSTKWDDSYPWLNTTSYWTSTRDGSQSSPHGYYYYVNENGSIGCSDATTYHNASWVYHGIRPVVSVDKSIF